jgi:hypothetical protein
LFQKKGFPRRRLPQALNVFNGSSREAGLSNVWKLIVIGHQFAVQAINHGVVVSSARQQQCTRKGGAREQVKPFTDSSDVRLGVAGRTDNTNKQTPLQREFWTNKKITEFGASITTPAFQSGQHNRWLAAEMCGEHADIGSTEL